MRSQQQEKKFEEIVETHRDQVYRMCWGFANNSFDVDDLFQDAMINIWKGHEKFEGNSALLTWIYRVTVNTCLLWKRRKSKSIESQKLENVKFEVPIENDEAKNDGKIKALRSAIQQLKKIDKTLILLLLEGCTYKEISEITGLTTTNVGAKLNRIKAKIKKLMTNN